MSCFSIKLEKEWFDIFFFQNVFVRVLCKEYHVKQNVLVKLTYAVFSQERFTTVTAYRGFVTIKSQLLETLFARN